MLVSDRRQKASAKPWDLHSKVSVFTTNSSINTVHGLWAGSLGKWLISFSQDHFCNPPTGMESTVLT